MMIDVWELAIWESVAIVWDFGLVMRWLVSSANWKSAPCVIRWGRSLTYRRKRRGESTEPWGTPCLIVRGVERIGGWSGDRELIRTTWERLVRKEAIHLFAVPRIPRVWSLWRSSLWSMVSNALLRS